MSSFLPKFLKNPLYRLCGCPPPIGGKSSPNNRPIRKIQRLEQNVNKKNKKTSKKKSLYINHLAIKKAEKKRRITQ